MQILGKLLKYVSIKIFTIVIFNIISVVNVMNNVMNEHTSHVLFLNLPRFKFSE